MRYCLTREECQDLGISTRKEWLLTNGLGGYAMGTPSTVNTRRYHGLLVAAIQPPATRMVLLAGLECHVQVDNEDIGLSANQYPGATYPEGYRFIERFEVNTYATWTYAAANFAVTRDL